MHSSPSFGSQHLCSYSKHSQDHGRFTQTTLKIMVGCKYLYPSIHFHCACKSVLHDVTDDQEGTSKHTSASVYQVCMKITMPPVTRRHTSRLNVQLHGDSIPPVTQHRASRQRIARASEPRQACEMNAEHPVFEDHTTHVQLVCHRAFEMLPLPPKSWRLARSLTHAQQRHDASTH